MACQNPLRTASSPSRRHSRSTWRTLRRTKSALLASVTGAASRPGELVEVQAQVLGPGVPQHPLQPLGHLRVVPLQVVQGPGLQALRVPDRLAVRQVPGGAPSEAAREQ